MVTVAALFVTGVIVGVIPVGAAPTVVPAAVVYHAKVPFVPATILAVVTANVDVPDVPLLIVPDWAVMLTVGSAPTVKVKTEEIVEPKVTVK